jgi:anti-sigma regulatory factor (Ser/Thr protein kinase)
MAGAGAPAGANGGGVAGGAVVVDRWEISPSAAEVSRARRELGTLLQHRGVTSDVGDAVLLVAHELLVNGVEHGHTAVRLTVALHPTRVRLDVRDGSPAPPALQPMDPLAMHGRGLQMVAAFADRWGWYPDGPGKTVWAEVPVTGYLGPTAGPAA